MKLWQLPTNENQVNNSEEFWVSYEYCELPVPKLKLLTPTNNKAL